VKQGDAEWAMEAMSRLWSEETLGGKKRLKADYPDYGWRCMDFLLWFCEIFYQIIFSSGYT
jgi:hypothetical protein